MTTKDLFEKMKKLKVTRTELADRVGAYPHSFTDFKDGKFGMTEEDARRFSDLCDQIVAERLTSERKEVAA